jgi:PKHD-type hydroxylase
VLLKNNFYYFKKAVPIKTCEKILKAGHEKIAHQAVTEGKGFNRLKRKCKVAWINDEWIYEIINPFIHAANKQAGWNFHWDWNEDSQFTIYEKGHYYGWHSDRSEKTLDILTKKGHKNYKGKTRKLSLTLQLTEKSEYEGGDFQVMWISHDKKDFINIVTINDAKDVGTVIIFPSFTYHQVLPITRGKRESLVNWSLGNEFC